MALQFNYTNKNVGVTYRDAYADVVISRYSPGEFIDIQLNIYASLQAKNDGMSCINVITQHCDQKLPGEQQNVIFDTYFSEQVQKLLGNSLVSLSQTYLKTLPDFQGVIEV